MAILLLHNLFLLNFGFSTRISVVVNNLVLSKFRFGLIINYIKIDWDYPYLNAGIFMATTVLCPSDFYADFIKTFSCKGNCSIVQFFIYMFLYFMYRDYCWSQQHAYVINNVPISLYHYGNLSISIYASNEVHSSFLLFDFDTIYRL